MKFFFFIDNKRYEVNSQLLESYNKVKKIIDENVETNLICFENNINAEYEEKDVGIEI